MKTTPKVFLFVCIVSIFIGFVSGYIIGSTRFIFKKSNEFPSVFGLGTERIDTFKDPDGNSFDLISTFAFDDKFFHCIVSTNDGTFTLLTYAMGSVTIPKHSFAMSIDSSTIEGIQKTAAGKIQILGRAKSVTRVGEKYEEAIVPFRMTAVDGGPGHEKDSLVLTMFYSEDISPMQYAIFGPESHFGHGILSGNILITANNIKIK